MPPVSVPPICVSSLLSTSADPLARRDEEDRRQGDVHGGHHVDECGHDRLQPIQRGGDEEPTCPHRQKRANVATVKKSHANDARRRVCVERRAYDAVRMIPSVWQ